jgi:hypothetical protein
MRTCAIPIRTLQDFQDEDKAARIMTTFLQQRGFDLRKPYSMLRDVALGVYLFRQPTTDEGS